MTDLQMFSFIVLWLVILTEGGLLLLLYRHVGLIYARRRNVLARGVQAPSLNATNLHGTEFGLGDLLVRERNLFIFGSLGCSPCRELLGDMDLRHFFENSSVRGYFLISITEMESEEQAYFARNVSGPLEVFLVDAQTFHDYRINATPYLYVLDRSGAIVVNGPVVAANQVTALWRQAEPDGHVP